MKETPDCRRSSAYTLIELLVTSVIGVIVAAGVYAILYSSNLLTTKTTSINTTSIGIQNALDRIQVYLQQSYTAPYPITSGGIVVAGSNASLTGTDAYSRYLVPVYTGTAGTVTGTGVGIKFYRYVGGPYLAQIPSPKLSATSRSITVVSNTGAQICPPSPQAGDILLINTTALLNASTSQQAWATIASVSSTTVAASGSTTYVVTLTPPIYNGAPELATSATTDINYMYDNYNGSAVTWSTYLLRPTAFLVSYRNAHTELGLLDPCVTSGSVLNATSNYTTLVVLCSGSSALLTSGTPCPFSVVSFGGNSFVSVNMQVTADASTYLSNKQPVNGFSTYMGVSSMVQLKSKPF